MLSKLLKLYQWLPIIWQDEDWDYAYLLKLIKFKLSRMERVIGSHKSHTAHWEHRKVELAKAQLLISLFKDDPDDEWTLYYNTHTGEDINEPLTKDKSTALDLSHRREERNWKRIWAYFEKNMRNWWD